MSVYKSEGRTLALKNIFLVCIGTLITFSKFHNPQSLSAMKVSGIFITTAVLQCPLMVHTKWYPTGYAMHLIILKEKGSKYSAPRGASVKFLTAIVAAPKGDSVKAPKAKAVKVPKAKTVKAPKSKN